MALYSYVLPAAPNVLSVGRQCSHEGYGFYWKHYASVPTVVGPDGAEIPVEVYGEIPYFRDVLDLSLREEHRGDDAVPATKLEGHLLLDAARRCDCL